MCSQTGVWEREETRAAGAAQPPSKTRTGPASLGRSDCAPGAMALSLYRRPNGPPCTMTAISPPRQQLPQFRDRLVLGEQGLRVSPYCLGMIRDPETVGAAFEAGINFFFVSADMHWPLYQAA